MGIVIDYMQNLPLPHIPVQEIFYLRQLWVFEFCIHNLKTGNAAFYSCSFLNDYVNEFIPDNIDELYIFSDGCPGQNKNHTVIRFLMALVASNRFKKIIHYFPIRGHSFNDCDRDFATVKRKIKKTDRIYTHDDYIDLIKNSSNTRKFLVKEVRTSQIIDYKKWWPEFYKKTVQSIETQKRKVPKDQKISFQISQYNEFRYQSENPGVLTVSHFIDGFITNSFSLAKPAGFRPELPTEETFKAYNTKPPINVKKMDNLRSLIQYIPEDKKWFYAAVFDWPTTATEEQVEEDH